MGPQSTIFIVYIIIGLWIMSVTIQSMTFDDVYPVSYPSICKQRLRINTMCDKLEKYISKATKDESLHKGFISPPNMSNDIASKKMLDDVIMENEEDDYKSTTNNLSRFAYGILLFTILSIYCIYMSSTNNERKYDGKILPVYN